MTGCVRCSFLPLFSFEVTHTRLHLVRECVLEFTTAARVCCVVYLLHFRVVCVRVTNTDSSTPVVVVISTGLDSTSNSAVCNTALPFTEFKMRRSVLVVVLLGLAAATTKSDAETGTGTGVWYANNAFPEVTYATQPL